MSVGSPPIPGDVARTLAFAGGTLDTAGGVLERDGNVVRLTRRSAAVLRTLIAHAGTTVTREQLIADVWPDSFPTDDVVTKAIREIRLAVGDDPRVGRLVETVPRIGYRLAANALDPVAAGGSGAGASPDGPAVRDGSAPARDRSGPSVGARAWQLAAGAGTALVAWALVAWALRDQPDAAAPLPALRPSPIATALRAALISDVQPLTALPGTEVRGVPSPDGRAYAYSARSSLSDPFRVYVAPLDSRVPRPLTPDSDPSSHQLAPQWSPDGASLAFQRLGPNECAFMLVATSGGPPRRLAGCTDLFTQSLEFTPDGAEILLSQVPAGGGPQRVHRLVLASGEIRPLDYSIDAHHGEPDLEARYSADHRWLAIRRGRPPYSYLYVLPASGGTASAVLADQPALGGFDWVPNSDALLAAAGLTTPTDLWLVRPDGLPAERIATAQLKWPRFARRAPLAIGVQTREHGALLSVALGAATPVIELPRRFASTQTEQFPAIAPDGRRVAFVSTRSGAAQLYVGALDGDAAEPVTQLTEGSIWWPRWRSDGEELVFVHRVGDACVLRTVRVGDRWTRAVPVPGLKLRSADYAPSGSGFVIDVIENDRAQLRRVSNSGALGAISANELEFPRRVPGSTALVAVAAETAGLTRIEADGSTSSLLDGRIESWNRWGWEPTAEGVYYLGGGSLADVGVYFRAWGSTEDVLLARTPRLRPAYGLTIVDAGRLALIGVADLGESDLVMMRWMTPRG